jgi:hypothetical protein
MKLIDIVVFLVFSIVMLLFMAYPAIKITEVLEKRFDFIKKAKNLTILILTVILSLIVGAFLKFF